MLNQWFPNVNWEKMWAATTETLYMTGISTLLTFILGIILGLLLFLTAKGNTWENNGINKIISAIVNIFRSIPFIILIVLLNSFYKVYIWYDDW